MLQSPRVVHYLAVTVLVLLVVVVVLLLMLSSGRQEESRKQGDEANKQAGKPQPKADLLLNLAAFLTLIASVGGTMYFLHVVLEMHKAYWVVPIFGALGGLVGCLMRNNDKLPLVSFNSETGVLKLGFVGDMILGLGGASASVFLFQNTLKFTPGDSSTYPLLVSVCFLAGVFGRLFVHEAGRRMIREALDRATNAEEQVERLAGTSSMTYVLESREQYKEGRFTEAIETADKALSLDPTNVRAMNCKARALKKLGRVEEAWTIMEQASAMPRGTDQSSRENYGVILYNKICYSLLLNRISEQDAIRALRDSFVLFPRGRTIAQTDEDLASLRRNDEFLRLINESVEPQS